MNANHLIASLITAICMSGSCLADSDEYADAAAKWEGASTRDLVDALGRPDEQFAGQRKLGQTPALAWSRTSMPYGPEAEEAPQYTCEEDTFGYITYKDCEPTSAERIARPRFTDADSSPFYECQIYAELSTDGRFVERMLVNDSGGCQAMLPIPTPSSRQFTAAAD